MSSTRSWAKERANSVMAFSSFSPPWLAKAGEAAAVISTLSRSPMSFAGVRQMLPLTETRPSRMASLAFTLEGKAAVLTRYVSSRMAMATQRYAESYFGRCPYRILWYVLLSSRRLGWGVNKTSGGNVVGK